MAFLVALEISNDEWDVVVMDHVHASSLRSATDVLGRRLPCWNRLEAREGIKKAEALRLANQLKGMPAEARYALFRKRAPALRLRFTYQPDEAAFSKVDGAGT